MNRRQSGRQGARQSARQAAQQQWERQRRRRIRWIAVLAVVGLLAAGVIGVGVWQLTRPDPEATEPSAAAADGGLPVGDGPVTVAVYLDFQCPACRQFDQLTRPVLDDYLAERTVTLVYYPIAILDRLSTTEYSTRSAAAAGCAADAGEVDPFVAALLANQPPPRSAGLSDAEISQIGASVGLSTSFGQCVEDGTYLNWAGENTEAAADRGIESTPTVLVDGQPLPTLSAEALVTAVDTAAAGE